MIRTSPGASVEEIERRAAQNIAIRCIVDAKEIGYVVSFLASTEATAITGDRNLTIETRGSYYQAAIKISALAH
jgi:enoyl-[acyl-carrier-protein] reductase (NADH)